MSRIFFVFRRAYSQQKCELVNNFKAIHTYGILFGDSTKIESIASQDILLRSIKSATDTKDVLHYIKQHHSIMNYTHLHQAFKTIFTLQKSDRTNISNGEILNSAEFGILCNTVKTHARSIDLNDTISILKTLSYLGVSATSKLTSILLQLITKQVNELSLNQIIFLDFLIKDFKSTPLVDALKIALPIVFEANFKIKADRENISQLADLLRYASSKYVSQGTVDFLVDMIIRQRQNIDLKNAKEIVKSLCELKNSDESFRPLLHHSLDVILDNIDKCTYTDLDSLLSNLASKFSHQNYYFYHEEFVQTVTDFVIKNDGGFEEGVWILKKANKFGHVNLKLLDYLSNKAQNEPWLLEACRISILFSFVHGFSLADYRPNNWHVLEPLILKNVSGFTNNLGLPWLLFVRDLCTLDTWSEELLSMIFSETFLNKHLSRKYNKLDQLLLLALHQGVETLFQSYRGPKPPKAVIDKAISVNGQHVTEFPLSGALSRGLGGDSYFLNAVYTKMGHFIDHLILLRNGGYPVSMKVSTNGQDGDERILVEDLNDCRDYQMVAILYLPMSHYCSNVDRLKGPCMLTLKTLEASGIITVPINSLNWEQLLEQEKIPYLMRAVSDKCGTLGLQKTS